MLIGTSYFESIFTAYAHYEQYGFSGSEVRKKFKAGEINIGKPDHYEGERLYLNNEGRWMREGCIK